MYLFAIQKIKEVFKVNYILLEGACLKIFIALIFLLLFICILCLLYTIWCDKKNYALNIKLDTEKQHIKMLQVENLKLRIKNGELNVDE